MRICDAKLHFYRWPFSSGPAVSPFAPEPDVLRRAAAVLGVNVIKTLEFRGEPAAVIRDRPFPHRTLLIAIHHTGQIIQFPI